jgi:Type II secretory pathway, ATPase PulE/Tfp pilus assembly pathway, ATPase PilB
LEPLVEKEIILFLGSIEEIDELKLLYKEKEDTDIDFNNDEDEIEKLKELASEAPVIKIINGHLSKAVELKSSDIHYEASKSNMRVRLRIDGVLQTIDTIPLALKKAIIARLKLLSKMNISENRLPQDGRISLKISNQEIDIRSSSVPTAFGESFVLRLLGKQSISYSLKNLDFFDDHLKF